MREMAVRFVFSRPANSSCETPVDSLALRSISPMRVSPVLPADFLADLPALLLFFAFAIYGLLMSLEWRPGPARTICKPGTPRIRGARPLMFMLTYRLTSVKPFPARHRNLPVTARRPDRWPSRRHRERHGRVTAEFRQARGSRAEKVESPPAPGQIPAESRSRKSAEACLVDGTCPGRLRTPS